MTASVEGELIGLCWGRGVAGSRGRGARIARRIALAPEVPHDGTR